MEDGELLGFNDGKFEGMIDGKTLGWTDGRFVGRFVGSNEGDAEGTLSDGNCDGMKLGCSVTIA